MVTCISVDLMVGNGVMRAGNFSPATTYLAPLNKDGDQRGAGFDGFPTPIIWFNGHAGVGVGVSGFVINDTD